MPISKDFNFETGKYEGRLCKYCNKHVQGRLDKRFCNDKCRISYRNEINSFKRKFHFRFDSEAHNYFLLARELTSRDIMVSRSVSLMSLSANGFDFRIPCFRFIGADGHKWFCLGNLLFRVFPDIQELRVRHYSEIKAEGLEEDGEISLEKAFPELNLRTFYQGPI